MPYLLSITIYLIVWGILIYRAFYKDKRKELEGYIYTDNLFCTLMFGATFFVGIISINCSHYEHYYGVMSQEEVLKMLDEDVGNDTEMKNDIRSALLDGYITNPERREIYSKKKNRKLDNFIYGE